MSVNNQILRQLEARALVMPQGLGATALICIDGPAGSGKTTLAAQLGPALGAQVVHMDDLYTGWRGIESGVMMLGERILAPLAQGEPGSYERFDWEAGEYRETHAVAPAEFLIIEGCASATTVVDRFEPLIIWVEAQDDVRLARGLDRDGQDLKSQWLTFMEDERSIYEANCTPERAHVRLDGFGNITHQHD